MTTTETSTWGGMFWTLAAFLTLAVVIALIRRARAHLAAYDRGTDALDADVERARVDAQLEAYARYVAAFRAYYLEHPRPTEPAPYDWASDMGDIEDFANEGLA